MSLKTLVIGASTNPNRYAHQAVELLKAKGHEIIAIGKNKGKINGITIHDNLTEIENLHTISLYINPELQEDYKDYLIKLKPQRVIFNPGTENPKLQAELSKHHINYEESCTLVLLHTGQYES